MSEKILISNAREAWLQACIYSNLILDGYVTLQYKKMFVSSLHNSVELLIKQRMLDVNDYRVTKIKKVNFNGYPATEYYSSKDLNNYFKINGTKDKKGKSLFYSIEFHELVDLHKEIFAEYYKNNKGVISIISQGIKLIENLRNDETHFYITDIDFLNGSQFKQLQIFMISFSKILDFYELLPTYAESVPIKILPNENIPRVSNYRLFLKANEDLRTIAQYLNGKNFRGDCEAFNIIDFLWFNTDFDINSVSCKYVEAISLISGAIRYNLVKLNKQKLVNDKGEIYFTEILEFKL